MNSSELQAVSTLIRSRMEAHAPVFEDKVLGFCMAVSQGYPKDSHVYQVLQKAQEYHLEKISARNAEATIDPSNKIEYVYFLGKYLKKQIEAGVEQLNPTPAQKAYVNKIANMTTEESKANPADAYFKDVYNLLMQAGNDLKYLKSYLRNYVRVLRIIPHPLSPEDRVIKQKLKEDNAAILSMYKRIDRGYEVLKFMVQELLRSHIKD